MDFAFPLQTKSKISINGQPNVTMIRAFVSYGISLIEALKQCEEESRKQLFVSITFQWPVLVCMMLLSGISGVLVWLLVRTWIIFVILYHISSYRPHVSSGLKVFSFTCHDSVRLNRYTVRSPTFFDERYSNDLSLTIHFGIATRVNGGQWDTAEFLEVVQLVLGKLI